MGSDILVIHYSGHGTRVRSSSEEDGYDEALYLYDGIFLDDEFNELMMLIPDKATVVVFLDSCFSGGATRAFGHYYKSKYAEFTGEIPEYKKREAVLNHIVFSGCRSDQTSADAYINNRYNGAFTFCLLKTMDLRKTYKEWADDTISKVHLYGFEQVPTLEGPEEMINRLILT